MIAAAGLTLKENGAGYGVKMILLQLLQTIQNMNVFNLLVRTIRVFCCSPAHGLRRRGIVENIKTGWICAVTFQIKHYTSVVLFYRPGVDI